MLGSWKITPEASGNLILVSLIKVAFLWQVFTEAFIFVQKRTAVLSIIASVYFLSSPPSTFYHRLQMYIYRGKFNWGDYAKDEPFTIIFPSDFDLGEDAFASWTYWNKDQLILLGSVDSVTPVKNTIGLFYTSGLWIDIAFPEDDPSRKTLTANVYHSFESIDTRPSPSTLTLVYKLDDDFELPTNALVASPVSRIYYGTLTTSNADSTKELFILVIPNVVLASEPLCAYWMLTSDKTNVDISGSIQTLTGKSITYTDSTGKYSITGDDIGIEDSINITLTYSGASTSLPLNLAVTPTIAKLQYLPTEPMPLQHPSKELAIWARTFPGANYVSQSKVYNVVHRLPTPMNLLGPNEQQTILAAAPKVSLVSGNVPTPQNTTVIGNDLREPVWCTMYEADESEPSTFWAWLGLGLSVVGLKPELKAAYALTVGSMSLILSAVGVYDAVRAGPELPETDTLYQGEAMYRVALRGEEGEETTNAATFIRVHVVDGTKLVISRAKKSRLPPVVLTSAIFADSSVTTDLFSIIMDNPFKILPFRIFEIKGLVPCQGTVTTDNTWFEGPEAVKFTRGEMTTVNISTTDRKTLTRYGPISVDYSDGDDLFKYDVSTLFLCVEDGQNLKDDGYDFLRVSNTDKGMFLRLGACTVEGDVLSKDCGVMITGDKDVLGRLLATKYRDFDIYWLKDADTSGYSKLWAAKFDLDPKIKIKPKKNSTTFQVLVRVTNWHGELRMSRTST